MPRKKAKPKKRPANPCSWSSRCKRPAPVVVTETERYCKTHAKLTADTLVGTYVKHVRDLECVSCGTTENLQWAHIRSRGATTIRWFVGPPAPGNSVALCAREHQFYTLKPAEWDKYVEKNWPGLWTQLVHLEIELLRQGNTVDVAEVIRDFRERIAA